MRPEIFVILRTETSVLMRYTYRFTQISREENGNLVPITDKPYEFIFTFGKKIGTFVKDSPDDTVLFTKEMWKEYPATNAEILPTVCFSTPSQQGFRRPLVLSEKADQRAGAYRYDLVYDNEVKDGSFLSEDLRRLTKTFVKGVRAVNDDTLPKSWHSLEDANVKHLMSYIKSYVYVQLLQNRDNKGQARAEDFLKKVLETFFSLIPDKVIEKFDKGLMAHDEIRERLEGVPEDDIATHKAVLKSQGYFDSIDDYKLFVVLRDYILGVKNRFNHLVWVMYRSKIGLVSLKSVRAQLSALFGFVIKVDDDCKPKNKKQILETICRGDLYYNAVAGFLNKINSLCGVKDMNKTHRAAICYKFQEECHYKYLSSKYKYDDALEGTHRPIRQEEFRDLCLCYWGINEKNTLRPNKCPNYMGMFNDDLYEREIWKPMREKPKFP